MSENNRVLGTVKFFSNNGWGFATVESGLDVFLLWKHLPEETADELGRRSVAPGDVLEFEVEQTPKGLSAVDVTVLSHAKSE